MHNYDLKHKEYYTLFLELVHTETRVNKQETLLTFRMNWVKKKIFKEIIFLL